MAASKPGGLVESAARVALLLAGAKFVAVLLALLFAAFFAVALLVGPPTLQAGEVSCGIAAGAERRVPEEYLDLYEQAGRDYGLDPAVLAAIGDIESGHGENKGPSSAGALGPMQFMPGTWAGYGVDGNGDGRKDVWDPHDAIPGAANYLRANGAPDDWPRAIFAYNHADWYVRDVLERARAYRGECRHVDDGWSASSGKLAWPVRGPVTSPFGMRWGRLHAGIDIGVLIGTPVHAAQTGRVELAHPVSGYGNYVCVRHRPRLSTCYGHLSAYRTTEGRVVDQGAVIGLAGCTGHCLGPHLHFEVRLGPPFSKPVDPMPYLRSPA